MHRSLFLTPPEIQILEMWSFLAVSLPPTGTSHQKENKKNKNKRTKTPRPPLNHPFRKPYSVGGDGDVGGGGGGRTGDCGAGGDPAS
jgi:hypothetical protein